MSTWITAAATPAGEGVGPYGVALITAAAAIIGGMFVAGSNLLISRGERIRAEQRETKADLRELRTAARLVLHELDGLRRQIKAAVEEGRYRDGSLPTAALRPAHLPRHERSD